MKATVLLVDDEPDVVAALRLALRHHPYRILTATSGPAGLTTLERREVDVVVSDEQMAEMSGSKFLGIVRERFPDIERIVLTGHASLEATVAAINHAQVAAFLTKPCDVHELATRIDEAVEARMERRRLQVTREDLDRLGERFDDALDDMAIWYQPIVDRDGNIVANEALMRPQRSFATPDAAVAAAAKLGREHDLDRAVRTLVAHDIEADRLGGSIFVNLLPESLRDEQLGNGSDPLDPHAERVVIEVTERAHLSSIEDVQPTVAALRECGYSLAVDDLGAGYAGLTSVVMLRPDVVKFDMELVRHIDTERAQARLVSGMLATCRDMGIRTLAEGIETPAEHATLAEMQTDLFQGYLLGKPAPLTD